MRKILSPEQTRRETSEFISYLGSLIKQKIVTPKDLDLFLAALEQNTLINPVPNREELKFHIHHTEMQALIETWDLDRGQIQEWTRTQANVTRTVVNQKETSESESAVVPVYVGPDRAMFYKIKHPKLGDAYRILKPGGHYHVETDWEEDIWPVKGLRFENQTFIQFKWLTNEGGVDLSDISRVSKASSARKGCIDLEGGTDLPTLEAYKQLLHHFDHEIASNGIIRLVPEGLIEFRKLFPDCKDETFWTSTIFDREPKGAWQFYVGGGGLGFGFRDKIASVRCVGRLPK